MARKAERVFLDSSVIIAAALSPSGGSFYILNNLKGEFEFHINQFVLEELTRVAAEKFSQDDEVSRRIFLLIGLAPIKIDSNPSRKEVVTTAKVINKEDAPILASAVKSTAYLLTLDNDFLQKPVREFANKKGVNILKPQEFIQRSRD